MARLSFEQAQEQDEKIMKDLADKIFNLQQAEKQAFIKGFNEAEAKMKNE